MNYISLGPGMGSNESKNNNKLRKLLVTEEELSNGDDDMFETAGKALVRDKFNLAPARKMCKGGQTGKRKTVENAVDEWNSPKM